MPQTRNRFETLARFGYAARGAVYFIIGMIALFAGFAGGGEASPEGALATLLEQPYGRIMLGAMAVGLAGFVLWRLCQGLLNADNRERDAKGYLARAGKVISAIAYTLLAITAAQMALGNGGGSAGQGNDGLVAWVMALPFGKVLVGAIGLGIVAAGIGQIWKGLSGAFKKRLRLPPRHEKLLGLIGIFGLAARGVVFVILGGFIVYAAMSVDPERAGSLPEALDWVRSLPFGGVLYIGMALGLLAFAVYCGIQALYRYVDAPTAREIKQAIPGI